MEESDKHKNQYIVYITHCTVYNREIDEKSNIEVSQQIKQLPSNKKKVALASYNHNKFTEFNDKNAQTLQHDK